jgi:SP family general alpha glucoside:H+ symporter-like MFS transporter
MWPLPLLIGIILAPESPWWLVRKGRYSDAEKSVRRLTTRREGGIDPTKTVAMMIHTDQLEKEAAKSEGSYWECFKGTNLRRTEIACMVWMVQTLCGNGLGGFSTLFFEQAGLSTVYSFDFTMGQFGLGAIGVFFSWFAMAWYGRRTLYLVGLVGLGICLLVVGFVALSPSHKAAPWVTGGMLILFTFIYDCTVGPVCYSLVSEIPSSTLRNKTVVLARTAYNVVGIFNNIITPRMISPTAWGWAGKSGFFWAGSCLLCFVWVFFRLPEPKGKTFAEIDILFERRVAARKFKDTLVDPFEGMVGEPSGNVTTRESDKKA